MAVRGGFVVGTGSFSCQDILMQVRMEVPTSKWRPYPKKKKKNEQLNNKYINKNTIKNYTLHVCSYFLCLDMSQNVLFPSKCAFF